MSFERHVTLILGTAGIRSLDPRLNSRTLYRWTTIPTYYNEHDLRVSTLTVTTLTENSHRLYLSSNNDKFLSSCDTLMKQID